MIRVAALLGVILGAGGIGTAVGQAAPDSAQGDTVSADPSLAERFDIGETMLFEGRFGILRLGRAAMRVVGIDTIRGTPTLHFRFQIRVNAAGLYRMDNKFESWVGWDDFFSRRFVQDYHETGQTRTNRYEIYPDSGFYRRPDVDTALTAARAPLDDTAFFYFVRTLDLEPGDTLRFDRYFRPDRNPVIITVIERDTIEVPAGRFPTIVIHPIIKGGGIFREAANARLWISDDPDRLIVQMKSKFGFGTVTLRLTGVEDRSPRQDSRDR